MTRPSANAVLRGDGPHWRAIIVDEFGEDFADGYDAWVRADALREVADKFDVLDPWIDAYPKQWLLDWADAEEGE